MEIVKRFRLMAVGISLAILLPAALGVFFVFDAVVAQGLLLGGFAGMLAFWLLAVRLEKFASLPANKVQSTAIKWTFIRLAIYALALGQAFYIDPERKYGLLAGVAGLFTIRLVMIFLALTGLDLKTGEK